MKIPLIILLLSVLSFEAHAEACRSSRGAPQPGGAYWSWRLIDGRKCWYIGRPNKPKQQLRWQNDAPPSPPRRAAMTRSFTPPMLREPSRVEAPPPFPITIQQEVLEQNEPPQAEAVAQPTPDMIRDALLASTCCWPKLDEPLPPIKVQPPKPQPSHLPFWAVIITIATVVGTVVMIPTIARRKATHERAQTPEPADRRRSSLRRNPAAHPTA